MSKAVKELMMRDYQTLLDGVEDALVISIRGVGAGPNNAMRLGLGKKNIKVTVVRNALARKSMGDAKLSKIAELLEGPCALAYSTGDASAVDIARELVDWAKKIEKLELKGAILDGEVYKGKAGVEKLSKYPTRVEAQGQLVTLVLSPARKLAGQIKGPGGRIAGIVKTIQEKLEKGEAISAVG